MSVILKLGIYAGGGGDCGYSSYITTLQVQETAGIMTVSEVRLIQEMHNRYITDYIMDTSDNRGVLNQLYFFKVDSTVEMSQN